MRIRTLFFAAYRDLTGASELTLELPDGATVLEAVSAVRDQGESFRVLPVEPAVAVNHTYATSDQVLADGDELAFIPPVAGG